LTFYNLSTTVDDGISFVNPGYYTSNIFQDINNGGLSIESPKVFIRQSGGIRARFENYGGLALGYNTVTPPMSGLIVQGLVGLGTTSPSSKLSVYGDALLEGSNRYLNFGTATGTAGYGFFDNNGVMQFKNASGSWTNFSTSTGSVNYGTSGQLAYYGANGTAVTGTSSLFLATNGFVGIGTTTPGSQLTVVSTLGPQLRLAYDGSKYVDFTVASNGEFTISPTGYSGGSIMTIGNSLSENVGMVFAGSSTPFYLALDNTDGALKIGTSTTIGSSTVLTILKNGNVGIGTTSPTMPLFVNTSASNIARFQSAGSSAGVQIYRDDSAGASNAVSLDFGTIVDGVMWGVGVDYGANGTFDFGIAQGGTPRILVKNNTGYTGIGTSSPSSKLTVYGDAYLEGSNRYLNFGTATGTNGYGFYDNSGTLQFKNSGGAWANISTSTIGYGTTGQIPYYAASSSNLTATSALVIGTNGYVGIGTPSASVDRLSVYDGNNNALRARAANSAMWAVIGQNLGDASSLGGGVLGISNGSGNSAVRGEVDSASGVALSGWTNSMTTGNLLNLYHSATAYTGDAIIANMAVLSGSFTGNFMNLQKTGVTQFKITNDGSTAIGTSSPSAKLTVWGAGTTTGITMNVVNAASSSLLTVLDNGNVGIGTNAPSYSLDLRKTATQSSGDYAAYILNTWNGTSAGTSMTGLGVGAVGTTGNANNLTNMTGISVEVGANNINTITNLYGINNSVAVSNGSQSVTTAYGSYNNINAGAGSVGKAIAVSGLVSNLSGTITNAYSLYAYNTADYGAGSITNSVGVYVAEQTSATANKTNLLIATSDTIPSGNYSIYNSSTRNNYFAGNLGIGTSTPAYKLTVNSSNATDNLLQIATTTNQQILVVNNTGNLGIGSVAPQEKLIIGAGGNLGVEMATPSGVTAATTTGGSLPAGTYYFRVSASDGVGATIGSSEVSRAIAAGEAVTLSWSAITGASSYRVFGNATGAQNHYFTTSAATYTYATSTGSTAGTPPAATTAYVNKLAAGGNSWLLGGNLGIGTTTPAYKLTVVSSNATDNLLQIATTTNQSIFVVNNQGKVGIGTTSPSAMLEVSGPYSSTWNLKLTNSENPSSYATFSSGGIIDYRGGSSFSLRMSGTERFYVGTTGNVQLDGNLSVDGTGNSYMLGNLGIGTTSPSAKLTVWGTGTTTGYLANFVNAASTTALSILDNGTVTMGSGAFQYDGTTGVTSIDSIDLGSMNFDTDAGIITWIDMPVATTTAGIIQSYTAKLDGNPLLTIYGETDGSGGVRYKSVGIGTTTPLATLAVMGEAGSRPVFDIASSTGASMFRILATGNVGIGTAGPRTDLELYKIGGGSTIYLSDSDLSHGMTSLVPDNVAGVITQHNSSNGGIGIRGYNGGSNTDSGVSIYGYLKDSPTATIPAVIVRGYKRSGSSNASLASNETIFGIANSDASPLLSVLGGGNVGIGTSSPSAKLTVWGTGTTTAQLVNFVNSASTTLFTVLENGNIGLGTVSPQERLTLTSGSNFGIELATPSGVTTGTTTGGSLPAGTYYFKVAASDGVGTTTGSSEVSRAVNAGEAITISWSAVTGASSYRVYGNATGAQNHYFTTSAATYTYATSTGSTAGTPPTSTTAYINKLAAGGNSWLLGGNVGIGTTSPYAKLTVWGTGTSTAYLANFVNSASTTLLSIQENGTVTMGNGAFQYDGTTGITSLDALALGSMQFDPDSGVITWIDMPVSTTTANLQMSYTAQLDGNSLLTVYGETDGSGGVRYKSVGIGTTTPLATLAVMGEAGSRPVFDIASSTGASLLRVLANGNIGIGTTSPSQALSVNGLMYIGGSGTSTIQNNLQVLGNLKVGTSSLLLTENTLTSTGNFTINGITITPAGNMQLPSANSLAIGTTSPSARLTVWGTGTTTAQLVNFVNSASTTLFTILENGNVGIGTTSPSYLLTVAGDIKSSTGLYLAPKENIGGTTTIGADLKLAAYESNLYFGRSKVTTDVYDETLYNFGNFWTLKSGVGGANKYYKAIAMSADGSRQTITENNGWVSVSSDYGNTWATKVSIYLNWQSVAMSADGSRQTVVTNNGPSNGAIYLSTDYGNTWATSTAPIGKDYNSIAMSADGSRQTAVVTAGYIYTSGDYGTTWATSTAAGSRNWYAVAMSADGSRQTAVVDNGNGSGDIYVSTDYGNSWTAKGITRDWRGIAMSADGARQTAASYNGSSNGYIYVSTDYGNTWTAKITDQNRWWQSVAMSADGARQIAGNGSSGVFVSTDYGSTWTAKTVGAGSEWIVGISADGTHLAAAENGSYYYISTAEKTKFLDSVGIGTTTPSYKLTVVSNNATDNLLQIATTTNQSIFVINNQGNVGIGTSSPSAKLTVWGTGTGVNQLVNFVNSASTTLFTILENGNIGIGTNNPSTKLDIDSGNIDITSGYQIHTEGYDQSSITMADAMVIGSYLTMTLQTTNNDILLVPARNVGIGTTSPSAKLTVWGVGTTTNIAMNVVNAASSSLLIVLDNGKVGIGTSSPYARFSVVDNGGSGLRDVFVISTSTTGAIFKVDSYGQVWADNGTLGAPADYAEYFYTTDTDLGSGEAVCVDVENKSAVKRCLREADNDIIGIVSTRPLIVGNAKPEYVNNKNYVKVAMLGQIPAKVSAENGPVRPGDSLTSAKQAGYIARAEAGDSTVGVALETLEAGNGIINVLISRRNKSLTVEQVEQSVTDRIAAMKIEDEVRIMISSAVDSLNLGTEITPIVNEQIALLKSGLTVSVDDLNSQLISTKADVALLAQQVAALGQTISNLQFSISNQIKNLNDQIASSTILSSNSFKIDEFGNIKMGNDIAITSTSSVSDTDSGVGHQTPEVAIVEIDALSTATALVVRQMGDGNIAEFQGPEVSVMTVEGGGEVKVVGTLGVDGRILVCSGGVCPAGLDNSVDSTLGDVGVEGKVVAGAYESYCADGFIWVSGSSKYGTMPGFCLQSGVARHTEGRGLDTDLADITNASSTPWVNISQ
ncbi:MAG: hypothetical protein WC840_04005, partial [Candidatus Peribacteraceae bacterium]